MAIAETFLLLFAISFKIVGRLITLEREIKKPMKRIDNKTEAKKINSDNFIRSNTEKSNHIIGKITIS